jgi:seryl-tRNA synthetase
MIYKYSEWIKESETVEAPPVMDLAAQPAVPAVSSDSMESEPPAADLETFDETTEIGKFQKLDQDRKTAVKAFKDKQKEFLAIAVETRKSPVTDEDKEKVKTLKDSLIILNKTMKDAEAAFNKFNDEALGLGVEIPGIEAEDIEP